jgi:hypothetical protein
MPKAYWFDLREQVGPINENFRATGRLKPKPSGGRRHAKLDPHRAFARPDRRKSRYDDAGTRS